MAKTKARLDAEGVGTLEAQASKKRGRKPGRPPASEKGGVSRRSILSAALKLAKTRPLQDLSIVVVARAINVTPALIHYYIGGRDWLTSGIMNLFYRNLLRGWPKETGQWWEDIKASSKHVFEVLRDNPGIAAYLVSSNQFRIFQLTAFGDRDFGVEVLDRFAGSIRKAGLSPERTGIYSHLIMEFVITCAHKTGHKLYPHDQQKFLEEKIEKMDQEKFSNIVYGKNAPLHLDGATAFDEGMEFFHLGMVRDRLTEGVEKKSRRK